MAGLGGALGGVTSTVGGVSNSLGSAVPGGALPGGAPGLPGGLPVGQPQEVRPGDIASEGLNVGNLVGVGSNEDALIGVGQKPNKQAQADQQTLQNQKQTDAINKAVANSNAQNQANQPQPQAGQQPGPRPGQQPNQQAGQQPGQQMYQPQQAGQQPGQQMYQPQQSGQQYPSQTAGQQYPGPGTSSNAAAATGGGYNAPHSCGCHHVFYPVCQHNQAYCVPVTTYYSHIPCTSCQPVRPAPSAPNGYNTHTPSGAVGPNGYQSMANGTMPPAQQCANQPPQRKKITPQETAASYTRDAQAKGDQRPYNVIYNEAYGDISGTNTDFTDRSGVCQSCGIAWANHPAHGH